MTNKIAFIGIGNMGFHMARNLKKEGHEVCVFDVNSKSLETAQSEGFKVADSATDSVEGAEFVFSMLPSSPHVESLYSDELFENIPSSAIVIDCSTISPHAARRINQRAHEKGFSMLDAPVSGGTAAAEAGKLTFMVGGEADPLEKTRPFFETMGAKVFHAGQSGSGQVAKICNNMLLAIHMIGSSEAIELGKACGIDPKVLSEIMLQSSGKNWSLEVYNPHPGLMENVPSSRDYQGGFAVDLMAKDLGLAMEAALESHASTPLGLSLIHI